MNTTNIIDDNLEFELAYDLPVMSDTPSTIAHARLVRHRVLSTILKADEVIRDFAESSDSRRIIIIEGLTYLRGLRDGYVWRKRLCRWFGDPVEFFLLKVDGKERDLHRVNKPA